ncbi:hypothetical protein CTA2_3380 [Colletotrichum tanaceti]|nr:hypothetical protein CTA2_3380 [Colletotrichum tanaceti]
MPICNTVRIPSYLFHTESISIAEAVLAMACICDKLRREEFSSITPTEAEFLQKAYSKAAHLFTASRPTRRIHKRASNPSRGSVQLVPDAAQGLVRRGTDGQPAQQAWSQTNEVNELESSYPCQSLEQALDARGGRQLSAPESAAGGQNHIYVRIFLAVERSDQAIELRQLSRRFHCYSLAQLHPKGTSVDPIVKRIKDVVTHDDGIKKKVYNILWVGRQWAAIVELLDSIAKAANISVNAAPSLLGVLCVLGKGSTWERASDDNRRVALCNLARMTDLCQQADKRTGFARAALDCILNEQSFAPIESPSTFSSGAAEIHRAPYALQPNKLKQSSCKPGLGLQIRPISTAGAAAGCVGGTSMAALPPGVSPAQPHSKALLVLLCFLADAKVSAEMLHRGGTPRERWTEEGGIEMTCAPHDDTALQPLLSDLPTLHDAMAELERLSAISLSVDGTCTLHPGVRAAVLQSLPPESHSFWRWQALATAYRAVPWKYLEPAAEPHTRSSLIPHVVYTMAAVREHDGYDSLSIPDRVDVALTLIEASRFPGIEWKRHAVEQAKAAMCGWQDDYVQACIAQRESLLQRLAGNGMLPTRDPDSHQERREGPVNKRMNAAIGLTVHQRALDCFQNEELSAALDMLEEWQPAGHSSPAEDVVLFRMNVLRGKILRFQGKFQEALGCMNKSQCAAEQHGDVHFDEDAGDLLVEMADIMRELDETARAEQLLRTQLERPLHTPIVRALLSLALAESLFAQQRFTEADQLCRDAESCRLSKMARLRLCITAAKLRHVSADWEGAFSWWTQALIAINKFPPTSGHTTRLIYLSLCDVLKHQGREELEQASRTQVVKLESLSGNAQAKHWMAGLRHWQTYLESSGL